METKTFSPLLTVANNIVKTKRPLSKGAKDYDAFVNWLGVSNKDIKKIKLPKVKKVENLEFSFGSALGGGGGGGGILGLLLGGAAGGLGVRFLGKGINAVKGFGKNAISKIFPRVAIPAAKKAAIPAADMARKGVVKGWEHIATGAPRAIATGADDAAKIAAMKGGGKLATKGGELVSKMIPGLATVVNLGISGYRFSQGDIVGGSLSALSAIPILGWAAVGIDVAREFGAFEGTLLGLKQEKPKNKIETRLKEQERTQREAASASNVTFVSITDKFDKVVSKFEKFASGMGAVSMGRVSKNSEQESYKTKGTKSGEQHYKNSDPNAPKDSTNTPSGEDVTLDGEGTFIQGNTGRSDGPHFHIGPTELYDPVGDKWVGKNTEQGKKDAREAAFKVAKTLMQRKKYFRFTNAGIDVNPGSKLDDATLMKYVEREQYAHANRPGGGSWGGLDIAGDLGLRLPLPVGDVVSSIHGFGNSARILGTNAFVGHGMTGSKKTADANIRKRSSTTDPFVLELHADPNAKGQKTGLIPSNTSPDTAVSQALVSMFGTYGKNYRGGLGVTNRGGNMLESDMSLGAESNARRIVQAMMKDPKRAYHIFAGHADVTKGETGAGGEKEYNLKTAELVERLAKEQKLNVEYHKSIITNKPSDPNSNFSRIKAIMDDSKRPGISGAVVPAPTQPIPAAVAAPLQTQTQTPGTVVLMGNMQPQVAARPSIVPVPIPMGGGQSSGGGIVVVSPSEGDILNSLWKTMLLTNLSAA